MISTTKGKCTFVGNAEIRRLEGSRGNKFALEHCHGGYVLWMRHPDDITAWQPLTGGDGRTIVFPTQGTVQFAMGERVQPLTKEPGE